MFRPLPVLTLLAIPALALLVWLGSWQWTRMGEKADEIAAWASRPDVAPINWVTALCDIRASFDGRHVLPPDGVLAAEIRFHGRSASGALGWRIMSPVPAPTCLSVASGEFILVQTGFETFRGDRLSSPSTLTILRPPEPGRFDAENNRETAEFFRFDPADLTAAMDGVPIFSDVWLIESDNEMPPHLADVPPGQHLGYALTWWGLAIGLVGIYLLIHVQAGQLRFTRR
jgi:surfeit locus 1 family protein